MYARMTDHIAILKERIEKAKAKVQRYQKSLESAETELSDLETTLRVLDGIANEGDSSETGSSPTLDRQKWIAELLGVGVDNAQQPADLYVSYSAICSEDITIETFRTTIWRMKGKRFRLERGEFDVQGENGSYWKEPVISHQNVAAPKLIANNEKEPTSENAVGSDAGQGGAPTPSYPWKQPSDQTEYR